MTAQTGKEQHHHVRQDTSEYEHAHELDGSGEDHEHEEDHLTAAQRAAPELLEALRALNEAVVGKCWCGEHGEAAPFDYKHDSDCRITPWEREALEQARTAIRLASSEEQ